ncbi:MAG: zinc ABC transporter substrate-binding protein [Kiritimatiellales bacterium]|nr:zinc ABC transporter substrate-binding protein [Kiritimatiellales bacterium]
MNRISSVVLPACVLLMLLAAGCAENRSDAPGGKPRIAVSIPPQAGLVREITGDLMDIHVLVGEGQSPHTYEPTPRQMAALSESDVLLTIGVPFEKPLLKQITRLYPDLRIMGTQQGIPRREMHHDHDHDHDHGHVDEEQSDPHVWLNPLYAKTIAENICAALVGIDPQHTAVYRANLATLLIKLDALDAELRDALEPCRGETFYVFHPSFGYFGDAYGLIQKPVEIEGKDPSPRQLVQLIEQARAEHVRVIFVQRQFSDKSARAVAEALKGSVIPLDPLAENYFENLRSIALKVKQSVAHE